MPAPSPLAIATSSLQRLVKEERSYHEELRLQGRRVEKLEKEVQRGQQPVDDEEGEGENLEFRLGQERRALEETKAVLPTLQERILIARETLEGLLESSGSGGADGEDVIRAKKVIDEAKAEAVRP